jgi:tRNA nucleotidyltransferase (CCA-adding enzyme)
MPNKRQKAAITAIIQRNMPPELMPVMRAIVEAGGEPFVNGGFVRDAMFEAIHGEVRPAKDIDTEVFNISWEDLVAVLSRFGQVIINDVANQFNVAKLQIEGSQFDFFDFSVPRIETKVAAGRDGFTVKTGKMSKRKACSRRDFTINAALVHAVTGEFVDPFNGFSDVANRILRPTSRHFGDDPLRVLRGMQFCSRFNLKLVDDVATRVMMRGLIDHAWEISDQRRREEWVKWAKGQHPGQGIRFLVDSGWITLFPEWNALVDVPQSPIHHPEGKVLEHVCNTCDAMAFICKREGIEGDDRLEMMFGILSHDNGKATHTQIDAVTGKITSHGHDEAGFEPARAATARIFDTQRFIDFAGFVAKHHMAHVDFEKRNKKKQISKVSEVTLEISMRKLAWIMEADKSGRPFNGTTKRPANVDAMIVIAETEGIMDTPPARIFTGQHLIDMGEKQGAHFKSILDSIFKAQIAGDITSVEQAADIARMIIPAIQEFKAARNMQEMMRIAGNIVQSQIGDNDN